MVSIKTFQKHLTTFLFLILLASTLLSGCSVSGSKEEPIFQNKSQDNSSNTSKGNYYDYNYELDTHDANRLLKQDVYERMREVKNSLLYKWGEEKDEHKISGINCSSFSMYPSLKCGDITLSRKVVDINQLSIGDVISYKQLNPDRRTCHRIIQHNGDSVNTKGDNNVYADPYTVNMSMDIYLVIAVFHTGTGSREQGVS